MNFEFVVERLSTNVRSSKSHLFFEFVEDFVRGMASEFTIDNLQKYLSSLVERVIAELETIRQLKMKQAGGKTLDLSKN